MSSTFDARVIKIPGSVFYANRKECPDLDLGLDTGKEVHVKKLES